MAIRQLKKRKLYLSLKRIIDIILAVVLFILLSPLMLVIAAAIRISSKGPIFFVQNRTGKNNKIFKLYKFRSMEIDNDVRNLEEEDKITKIGKVIRKTSLDELPNIINILKGEMSFIGPRPWIPEYALYFNDYQKRRLETLPGITGLAQCSGRNELTIYEKIDLDIEYVNNVSFLLDMKILFLTIILVFKKTGVENDKYGIRDEIDELKLQHMKINKNKKKETEELIGV